MELHVNLQNRRDLAGQIYRGIRAAILDGRLRPGDRLPPTRELAVRLDVSRNTIAVAYEWLTAEGLLAGRAGVGSFVQGEVRTTGVRKVSSPGRPLKLREFWRELPGSSEPRTPVAYEFRVGIPDARLFPFETWRRLVARQLRAATQTADDGEPAGHPALRASVARHVFLARGVRATADEVLITQGAQQALDLIGRVLIEPGACVAVEEPGYPPARLLFQSLGARVVGVPVDAEGLDVSALPHDARLVYVTPSHQFPLGVAMSPSRRNALLAWAEQRNAVVIEDDYDSEFRFGGRPLETLHGLDRSGRVVYVGSFSKVMLPGLRLGFLVAPPSLFAALRMAKSVADGYSQWPVQAALARFIDEGHLARHIRKMRREYESRHERIVEALTRHFSPWLEPVPSRVGLHVSAVFNRSSTRWEQDVVAQAREAGVGVQSLSEYCAERSAQHGLILGYGAMATNRIDEGLRRLRASFEAVSRARSLARG
ncbi:PLP-dependent aminotransferase family protein [Archangium minus]|uniref:PLP-dependent aminotransferase family protein n=1 Tax=Archangium minus TaxID=83450 RepID=A0ABY9X2Q7_9BACT|nr:PLP-dependent aminotransferase family protein [Archangium minus]